MRCPAGHEHERLEGDPPYRCRACGGEVVHAQGAEWDYTVWCTNAACEHHACHDVGDTECPTWAHGPPRGLTSGSDAAQL